jgi:hypothetical protein
MISSRKYSCSLNPQAFALRVRPSLIADGKTVFAGSVHLPNGLDVPEREDIGVSSDMIIPFKNKAFAYRKLFSNGTW